MTIFGTLIAAKFLIFKYLNHLTNESTAGKKRKFDIHMNINCVDQKGNCLRILKMALKFYRPSSSGPKHYFDCLVDP